MKKFIILLLISVVADANYAQTTDVRRQNYNVDKSGLALKGYDAVDYITLGKAVEGNEKYAWNYMGIIYRFENESNRNLFKKDPAKYEPAYGGWCAYAMGSSGEKVEVDPETFKIVNGKANLFYNFYFNNTLKSWNKDEKNLHIKAEQNWNKIMSRK